MIKKGDIILKGNPASQGKAEGKVCIVLNEKDFIKFKKGNILVTSITNPIFTPLIGMASAVVTDLGGSLSHAAIVSREMGIPAVVGTKEATKKLKDGDLAAVDGSKGIIEVKYSKQR